MNNLKVWESLEGKWKGKIYQKQSKEWKRLEYFEDKIAPLLKGMRVVDVGCNAGLHAVILHNVAKAYVGLEVDQNYFAQAEQTAKRLPDMDVVFIQTEAMKWLLDPPPLLGDYDALLLSAVLYHFPDADLAAFRNKVLPNVKFAIVCGRFHRPTIKNSYDLHEPGKVAAYFQEAGFLTERISAGHPGWFCVVCRRAG